METKSWLFNEIGNRYGSITNRIPVSGGCINNGCCLVAGGRRYFLKWNNARRFPGMFEEEAKGLHLLRNTHTFVIPQVIETGVAGDDAYILMEWMEAARPSRTFWYDFGAGLARMHMHSQVCFGLDHENYIGSLPQQNDLHNTWPDFFFHQRLLPQVKQAIDSGELPSAIRTGVQALYSKLPDLIPAEAPALLHGDLWNGNYLVGQDGKAVLIDPAVYFGHREMDLAMTKLFGGFDSQFYEGYNDAFPLEPGFESRVEIHNLYPLLVHVNLFGGGYAQQVKSILSRFQ